jgi:hypothetical protein
LDCSNTFFLVEVFQQDASKQRHDALRSRSARVRPGLFLAIDGKSVDKFHVVGAIPRCRQDAFTGGFFSGAPLSGGILEALNAYNRTGCPQ